MRGQPAQQRVWGNGIPRDKKKNLHLSLTPYANRNSKRIKDVNVKLENFEENHRGDHLWNPGPGEEFLDVTPKARGKTDKLDITKIKPFCFVKDPVRRKKR